MPDPRELWKFLPGLSFPVGDGRSLLHRPDTRDTRLLDGVSVDLLQLCRSFRTLDDHARAVRTEAGLPDADLPLLKDRLAALAAQGLLVSRREILDLLRRDASLPKLRSVGVLGETLPELPGDPEVVLIGQAEIARYRQKLGRPADLALPDASLGARWNCLLLRSAGERVLGVAPDVDLRPLLPPDPLDPALAFDGELVVRHRGATSPAAVDVLDAHDAVLGHTLADVALRPELDLEGVDARLLRALRDGARVALTQSGFTGDCGEPSSAWLLLQDPAALERLLASPEDYEAARLDPQLIASSLRPALGGRPFASFYALGLDHREILPPFPPGLERPDPVFAAVLEQCCPRRRVFHFPWLVRRGPAGRRYAPAAPLPDLLLACIQSLELSPAKPDGAPRLRALGEHLTELGTLPTPDFQDLARQILWLRAGHTMDLLEARLEQLKGAAPQWSADLRAALDGLRASLTSVPAEEDRDRIAAYGRLLRAWPELIDAARAKK